MFEVIKGAAAMAVVVTALVVITSAIMTHDSSVAPLALALGMVIGGVLGWKKSRRSSVVGRRPCKICGQSPCVEADRGVAAHVEWPGPPWRAAICGYCGGGLHDLCRNNLSDSVEPRCHCTDSCHEWNQSAKSAHKPEASA